MRITHLGTSLLILLATVIAFFGHPQPETDTAPSALAHTLSCQQLATMGWSTMSPTEQQLAEACDSDEAHQNWVLAYGQMNAVQKMQAVVYEPL